MKKILFVLLLAPQLIQSLETILVIPDSKSSIENIPKEFSKVDYNSLSFWGKVAYRLNPHDFEVSITFLKDLPSKYKLIPECFEPGGSKEDVKYIICSNIPDFVSMRQLLMIPKEKLILICWEPPTVIAHQHEQNALNRFKKVLHWDDSKVDGDHVIKMYYPSMQPMKKELIPFNKRKLCCMVVGKKTSDHLKELYSYRKKIIDFYSNKKRGFFDLYGKYWSLDDSIDFKGAPPDKGKVLSQYRFSYCFENTKDLPGYITEKIFDCFQAGTIPIYYGANNIIDYIPENCFINFRKFRSIEAVHRYILEMKEEEFLAYINNIQAFLSSEIAQKFTSENLIKTLIEVILND
jgi:hypothetical protein